MSHAAALTGGIPRSLSLFATASILLHVLLALMMVELSRSQNVGPKPHTRALTAKLVRLGEIKDPTLMPRLPAGPLPNEEPVNLSGAGDPSAVPLPTREERQRRIESALARITGKFAREGRPDPLAGDPNGSPDGEAGVASEGDRYLALIDRAVRAQWQIPSVIPEQERLYLHATVVIYLAPDGQVTKTVLEKPSSNEFFNRSLLAAITRAAPFSAPPAAFRSRYQREGIGINFRAAQ